MDVFIRIAAAVLLSAVACLLLSRSSRETGLLLSLGVCCMVTAAAGVYLDPVLRFFGELETVGNLDGRFLEILLKCVGIGFLTEISVLVCRDAGNEVLGRALQMLSASIILWLSLPLLTGLVQMIRNILGEI